MAEVKKYTKRVQVKYTEIEKDLITCNKGEIYWQMQAMEKKGVIIHENQKELAYTIIAKLVDRKKIITMILALTQSGKTGSMYGTIKCYLEGSDNLIPTDNIYIITGLSDKDWLSQTKQRLPRSLHDRIFHRNQLRDRFVTDVRDKKNVLIIMDEVQIACQRDQTITKAFREAGLLDIQKLYENDVKILEYTATPDGTLYQLQKWGDAGSKIIAKPGDKYVGCLELLSQGRVKQAKDICGKKKKDENDFVHFTTDSSIDDNIKEIWKDVLNYKTPRYHIIRTQCAEGQSQTKKNLEKVFKTRENYGFINYDQESDIQDINEVLAKEPKKHIFILIKEKLRCAKTLSKQYLGVLYERSTTSDYSSIIQGLLGRNTGYDVNSDSIVYSDIKVIAKYSELWSSEFEKRDVKWISKTTDFKDRILEGKHTFNDLQLFDKTIKEEETKDNEPTVKFFPTQEDLKKYYTNIVLKEKGWSGRGPNRVTPNESGQYEATIRSRKAVYSIEDIMSQRKYGLNEKSKFRCYPCYRDTTDLDTLEWCLIYKN
jgi:hypothetical protein